MVTILIKSFNRPFYLERCIRSTLDNVAGEYKIIVLDDGTPEKYLNKIRKKFEAVEIKLSGQYVKKSKAIQDNLNSGKDIDGFQIPTSLWIEAVKAAGEFVLVTEDDVWFTQKIDLDEMVNQMKSNEIHLLKLGWLGNYKDDRFIDPKPITAKISRTVPKELFTSFQFIMKAFMYNKFKLFSILYKLKLVDNQYKRRYWALNSILMGLYRKDYWLYIWKDAAGKVDEKQQLSNAAAWYHKRKKNKNLIARTQVEYLKTTFQSSATNSYHQYGFDFDVNYFNFLVNEAWYNGQFDPMQNFPNDFSMKYFEQSLDEKIDKHQFSKWVNQFREQYRNLGAQVD